MHIDVQTEIALMLAELERRAVEKIRSAQRGDAFVEVAQEIAQKHGEQKWR